MTFTQLETSHLILRKFRKNDFAAVHSYASVPENVRYLLFDPNTEETTHWFIDYVIKQTGEAQCREFHYAVELKENSRLIGGGSIHLREYEQAELGWLLHRDYWKQGYGTELARELLRFSFEELGLRRVIAGCDAENYGSYRIMENIGMRREARFVGGRKPNSVFGPVWRDNLWYGILRGEYMTLRE